MKTFVVSTGRCGSTSLARWLQDNGLATEMEPHAFQLCCLAYEKMRGCSWDDSVLTGLWSRMPVGGVVVDNNLSLFIEDLAAMGPCRFVWLIRNPWDCISSLMAWRWYRNPDDPESGDGFASHRPFPIHEMHVCDWSELPLIGKCAWYWKFLNLRIEGQLTVLDENCWVRVRLEDWSPAIARSLLRSAGSVDGVVADWRLPKMNSGPWDRDRPRWTKDEVALVTEVAGKVLARWYPERNFQMPAIAASGR